MTFKILGKIENAETLASGRGIREIRRLRKAYGRGRWLKKKGKARVQVASEPAALAEVHWYEAHGIGRREYKVKRFL